MSKIFLLHDELYLTHQEMVAIRAPKQGKIVYEALVENEPTKFQLVRGLVSNYHRQIIVGAEVSPGVTRVDQNVSYSINLLGFGLLLGILLRKRLRSIYPEIDTPIWLPPDSLDNSVARMLVRLLMIATSTAYFATLLGQTLTYSAREFQANLRSETLVLLLSRFDIVFGLLFLAFVQRRGRVAVIRVGTVFAALFSIGSAFAPNMTTLAILQVLAKGATAAVGVLITVSVAEVVSPRQRSWSIGLMLIGAALGAGLCDLLLPIAGFSLSSWRVLYLVSLPLGVFGIVMSRDLRETWRFEESRLGVIEFPREPSNVAMTAKTRWTILAVASFITNAFLIPTTQFRNQYLRVERHLSAVEIGAFVILTNLPGVVGLVLGGRLSETVGRKLVGTIAIVLGGGGIAIGFVSSGLGLWVWTIVGSAIIPAIVPSLGVYQTELFSTQARTLGGGYVTIAARLGSIVGVVLVGYLSMSISLGTSIAALFIGMVILVPILLKYFPETKGLKLEDIA